MRRTSLDRPSAHSRRPAEHEVILPTVEREQIDLTSPRRVDGSHQRSPGYNRLLRPPPQIHSPKSRAFPPLFDSKPMSSEQGNKRVRPVHRNEEPHHYAYQDNVSHMFPRQAVDTREPPPPQFVDLTTSPYRPLTDRVHVPPHPRMLAFEQNGHSYVPTSARPPLPREASGSYYRVPVDAPSHAYMPETRMYESRAPPPAHESIPRRDIRQHSYAEDNGSRYLRNGVKYGG